MLIKSRKSLILLLVALLLMLALPAYLYEAIFTPVADKPQKKIIEIKPGMGTNQIASMLENSGIIKSAKGFAVIARARGISKELKAGEYELDLSRTPAEILKDILKGKVKLRQVTVAEGLTIKETAANIMKAGFGDSESIISAAKDPAILDRFGITAKSAEGYLFPETYHFEKDVTAGEIVAKMILTFNEKVAKIKAKYQPASPLTFSEIVTLASIIEKETGDKSEYRLVSAVYNNRIKKGMRLQADPTVIYALPNFDGNIRRKDLRYDSPYNTYMYAGLPPGPIANPGLEAIEAAYIPAKVDYLYFVATEAGGKHYFSKTYKEHQKAVRKYQLRRKKR